MTQQTHPELQSVSDRHSLRMTSTVLDCLEDKYNYSTGSDDDEGENFDFIVFVSNSPETKRGMYPPVVTLIDQDIETMGKSWKKHT